MHADVFHRQPEREDGNLGVAIALAVAVHLLVALLFFLAWWWSPERHIESAAGSPMIEAALMISSADIRSAEQAMKDAPKPEPLPESIPEVAEQETVPPPQPIPEVRPQVAPVPQQQQAQERIAIPDTEDQDAADALAVSQEKALKEQEEKRRQEQIDLTERKRQQEAEQKQRLAKQQEEEKQKKLADIRRQREQAARQAELAEQKLRQLAQARAAASAQATATASPAQANASPGQGGNADDLLAKYQSALQAAIVSKWTRPDSVPLGTRCRIVIRQIPGGEVIEAQVQGGCPFDEAGKRSVERAVLMAQPLPFKGFEPVFARTLILNFTAQDR